MPVLLALFAGINVSFLIESNQEVLQYLNSIQVSTVTLCVRDKKMRLLYAFPRDSRFTLWSKTFHELSMSGLSEYPLVYDS